MLRVRVWGVRVRVWSVRVWGVRTSVWKCSQVEYGRGTVSLVLRELQ